MVTVSYNLEDSDCDFVLYNSNGNEILRENLQGFNSEKSIILHNLASCTYYYKIIKDNNVIKFDKLIITK
ncbi:MAG: T9SS type A sorting domain-containing protein [Bacteroidales bacterium]|nr:T9SS type A sorting domain-containing protein [Bacteroidales bacterium]